MSETQDPDEHVPGETLKANTMGPDQIHVDMNVSSIDGERLGKVKEVGAGEFLIDRPMARDLWVPFSAVLAAEDRSGTFRRGPSVPDEVVLSISAAHVDAQNWRHA
jgi:hypothetical protein